MFIAGVTVLTLGLIPGATGRLCERCAARHDALGLLMLALALGIGFVLAIVVMG